MYILIITINSTENTTRFQLIRHISVLRRGGSIAQREMGSGSIGDGFPYLYGLGSGINAN